LPTSFLQLTGLGVLAVVPNPLLCLPWTPEFQAWLNGIADQDAYGLRACPGGDDHGDSIATATSVAIGDTVQGVLTATDEDFFRIAIPRDDFPLVVFTEGSTDTYGYLLDRNGDVITSNDDSGARLNFRIAQELDAGTYYLRIRGASFLRPTGPYTLIVAEEDGTVGGGDFDLADANAAPGGITYTSGHFYVTDWLDDKVYAYTVAGARAADRDFDLIVSGIASAITYANDRFYVLYWDRHKVYAYDASGARAAAYDFDLDGDNRDSSGGMTYANGRFYVTDWGDDKVYAYDASGARAADHDFDLVTNPSGGIKFARDRFYVVNRWGKKVNAYDASGARAADHDFDLDDDNDGADGITYANGRFYIVNSGPDSFGPDDKVFAYDAAGQASTIAADFVEPPEVVVGDRVESGWLQALKRRAAEEDRKRKIEERRAAGLLERQPGR
jgi:outer membrane protein assembly factor BamB